MVLKTPHLLPIEPLKFMPRKITNTEDTHDKDQYDKLTQKLGVLEKHTYRM